MMINMEEEQLEFIKTNLYQTPLTEELRASMKKEVWNDLMEFVDSVKFINWLIQPEDIRGHASYAGDQITNRPGPYSTDFGVNSFTYGNIPSQSVPHGVGFVWATMLWDLTWAFIDEYGFDPDF